MAERSSQMSGQDLAEWRQTQGLTQDEAGVLLGRTKRTIQSYEAGSPIPYSVALACRAISEGWRDYGERVDAERPPAGAAKKAEAEVDSLPFEELEAGQDPPLQDCSCVGRGPSITRFINGLAIVIRPGNPVTADHVLGGEAHTLWVGELPVAPVFYAAFRADEDPVRYRHAWAYLSAETDAPHGPFHDLEDLLDHAISRMTISRPLPGVGE